ncbi:hypothetical protein DFH28DRAFT_1133205 [Melampsora americana]|nr:hypothetical protein DFH28DRAFT_1133205 [Melampsora americana]
MHPELHELFQASVSTFYLHGLSRGNGTKNSVLQGIRKYCDMRTLGHNSLNHATSHCEDRIWLEIECSALHLPHANDFWEEKFATLSMSAFKAIPKVAADAKVPSFDSPDWETSANGQVRASSIAITCDNLANKPHCNKDATPYAFGMFARVN